MVEAIFIDFYGTVVFEDGENVSNTKGIGNAVTKGYYRLFFIHGRCG